MKKFKALSWSGPRIEEVEIVRETDSSVFLLGGQRRAKVSECESYHDSWKEAHELLLARAEGRVSQARRALERANGALGNVKSMSAPKVEQ